ncbi:MAG TPA: ATP-binding cassette domain-containing protein [Planctomycetota bacterium]|nr:ATP-binding cassette domain-containing protein [Planctomycetota bacterium]
MNQHQQLDPIVQWDGVGKRRGKRQALEDFSLAVAPGRVLGLIGPNGAGKTTAIELLLGMPELLADLVAERERESRPAA